MVIANRNMDAISKGSFLRMLLIKGETFVDGDGDNDEDIIEETDKIS